MFLGQKGTPGRQSTCPRGSARFLVGPLRIAALPRLGYKKHLVLVRADASIPRDESQPTAHVKRLGVVYGTTEPEGALPPPSYRNYLQPTQGLSAQKQRALGAVTAGADCLTVGRPRKVA